MTALDTSLMDWAEPHFRDALVTFERDDQDLLQTAHDIALASQAAGFSDKGRRKLHEYLLAFLEQEDSLGLDPLFDGRRVTPPAALFSRERLGGLFNVDREPKRPIQDGPQFNDDEVGRDRDRALVDQLIADTRLYDSAEAVRKLLDFTARMRDLAPFNAMLLDIQKPGLSFAARPKDWWKRFRRRPKPHARPLVILRNFGPVEFVYDIQDTEGEPLPEAAFSFPTSGEVPSGWLAAAEGKLAEASITIAWLDRGDYSAGHARRVTSHGDRTRLEQFEVGVNRNHQAATQLVTLAHELGHILLGHCGADAKRGVQLNRPADLALREVEAETVAYLVAKRTGVSPRSEKYLERYEGAFEQLDLHRIFKAAGAVEKALGLPFRHVRVFQ